MRSVSEDKALTETARHRRTFKFWSRVTRLPFLTATLVPVLLGAAMAHRLGYEVSLGWLSLTLLAVAFLHIGTNTLNDYFDDKSGADVENQNYIAPFTGGSRAIQSGVIAARGMLIVSVVAFVFSVLLAVPLLFRAGLPVLFLGLEGLVAGIFYTAPPLRFVAKRGLGEFLIGLNMGPLMVVGATLIQTGTLEWQAFLAGIPVGLFVTAIIYINEFPDYDGDKAAGKNTLIVHFGQRRSRIGFVLLLTAAFLSIFILAFSGILPLWSLLSLLGIFLAYRAIKVLYRYYDSREIRPANLDTIRLHLISGILLTLAVWLG